MKPTKADLEAALKDATARNDEAWRLVQDLRDKLAAAEAVARERRAHAASLELALRRVAPLGAYHRAFLARCAEAPDAHSYYRRRNLGSWRTRNMVETRDGKIAEELEVLGFIVVQRTGEELRTARITDLGREKHAEETARHAKKASKAKA